MNSHQGPVGPWRRVLYTPAILDGLPWKAQAIRNACLRRHCHQLGRCFRNQDATTPALRAAARHLFMRLEGWSRVLTDLHPNELHVVPAVLRMAAYHEHWLRAPEDWCPPPEGTAREQWADLQRHLFARYPVPSFLAGAWLQRGPLEHFERDCYCALGAGRSLRTVTGFPCSVSHRVLHLALQDTHAETLAHALWKAQLRVLNASDALQEQVMESRLLANLPNHAEGLRLVAKFAMAQDGIFDFGPVVDALAMISAQERPTRSEALLRLPLGELRRHCRRWWHDLLKTHEHCISPNDLLKPRQREMLRAVASTVWTPLLPREWRVTCLSGEHSRFQQWRMVELCTHGALIAEGRAMRHCIASYAASCKSGRYAIFSLRHSITDRDLPMETRHLTVLASKRWGVVEVRGPRNAQPESHALSLVRQWAMDNHLAM